MALALIGWGHFFSISILQELESRVGGIWPRFYPSPVFCKNQVIKENNSAPTPCHLSMANY
jgi:hypothetical protein